MGKLFVEKARARHGNGVLFVFALFLRTGARPVHSSVERNEGAYTF